MSENREPEAQGLEREDTPLRPKNEGLVKLLGGRIACLLGVALGALAIFTALAGAGSNVSPGAVGVMLGVLGYFLGARRLGTATAFLCIAALFFGLAASQGLIPGLEASDHSLPTGPRAQ